jgi:ABC-type polysaccharide transport system permease subunit
MQNPTINMSSIAQFAQIVRAAELSQQKEIKIPIQQARLINLALVEIQQKLLQDYDTLYNSLKNSSSSSSDVMQVALDGGGFSDN